MLCRPHGRLRGDFERIVLKAGANVQHTWVMHGFPDHDTVVEEKEHIGDGAVLHSCCVVHHGAWVGMNAVIMNEAQLGDQAIVAACTFLPAKMKIPPRTLGAGVPAKVKREVSEAELAWNTQGTLTYQELTLRCIARMHLVEALPFVDPGRPQVRSPHVKSLTAIKPTSDPLD